MSSNDNHPNSEDDNNAPRPRKKRGVTMLKRLSAPEEKSTIQFDENGEAVGKNQVTFANYVGMTTKSMISITHRKWKDVDKEQKDTLWNTIKEFWNIEDDSCKIKKQVLKQSNFIWKTFKKMLRKEYLYADIEKNPCVDYKCINEDDWKQFVSMYSTPEFLELRKKGQENAKKNINPARLGPKGYRGNLGAWEEEKAAWKAQRVLSEVEMTGSDVEMTRSNVEMTESDVDITESDVEMTGSDVFYINHPRGQKYLLARRIRDEHGVLRLPHNLHDLAKNMLQKDREMLKGKYQLLPGQDVLTLLIGPEHPGRTRVVGHTIGLRQGLPQMDEKKRRPPQRQNVEAEVHAHVEALRQQMEDDMQTQVDSLVQVQVQVQLQAQMPTLIQMIRQELMTQPHATGGAIACSPGLRKSSVGSTQNLDCPVDDIEEPTKCTLFVPSTINLVQCATGMVYPKNITQVHGINLHEGHVKVQVDSCFRIYSP